MKYLSHLIGVLALAITSSVSAGEPLASWNDGANKQRIITFVESVTDSGSPEYVPVPERIAVFDNDGTLWSEKPIYFQLYYVIDRVKAMAPDHPEWKTTEPFASLLKGDMEGVAASGEKGLMKLLAATHAGMTSDEFLDTTTEWINTARHPATGKLYTGMVFQPMLELLDYLRANDFKTFIVSGGGIEFMRPWSEAVYGIPPEQVVGSSLKMQYELRDGSPVLVKLADLDFIDDKAGKPVGIQSHIGRRPIFAAGNSDGDFQMLEWTTSGDGARLGLLVHHTDADREWAYDRDSLTGKLSRGLDEAAGRGWLLVDMKNDWGAIYPDAD